MQTIQLPLPPLEGVKWPQCGGEDGIRNHPKAAADVRCRTRKGRPDIGGRLGEASLPSRPCLNRHSLPPLEAVTARLYDCEVMHARLAPKGYRFTHSVFALAAEVDGLADLGEGLRLLGPEGESKGVRPLLARGVTKDTKFQGLSSSCNW